MATLDSTRQQDIQPWGTAGTPWTTAAIGGTFRDMPLDLTDAELATAAQARRAMAHQEGKRAQGLLATRAPSDMSDAGAYDAPRR
jgi:hypothetical protein